MPEPVEIRIECRIWLEGKPGTAVNVDNLKHEFHDFVQEDIVDSDGEFAHRRVLAVEVDRAIELQRIVTSDDGLGHLS